MRKKTKMFISSLMSTSVIASGAILGTILTSCSKSNSELKTNNIVSRISINNLGLSNTTKSLFFNTYNNNQMLKKQLITNNLSKLVSGPIDQIQDNFGVDILNKNEEIYMKLTINRGFWYGKNGQLNISQPLEGEIHLTDFDNELNPDEGGKFNNLEIDKHLKLVDVLLNTLGINDKYNMSLLTNDILNNVYSSSISYKKLTCSIADESSTKTGVLKLMINGTYEGKTYNNEPVQISGFKTPSKLSKAFVSNIELNKTNWFNDLRPTIENNKNAIEQITSNDFVTKYIGSADLVFANQKLEYETFMSFKEAIQNNYQFEFEKPRISTSTFKLSTKAITNQPKKYINNKWQDDGPLINIDVQISRQMREVDIPTNNDSLEYLMNQTTFNENVLRENYASYFKGLAVNVNKLGNVSYPQIPNFIQNPKINSIKEKYFPNQILSLNLSNDPSVFSVNDFAPDLSFIAQISLNDAQTPIRKQFRFTGKTKSILPLMEQISSNTQNKTMLLKNNEGWGKRLIQSIKNQYSDRVNAAFNTEDIVNEVVNVSLSSPITEFMNKTRIYSIENNEWNRNNENLVKLSAQLAAEAPSIFGLPISYQEEQSPSVQFRQDGELNINSGLFRYNQDNIFMIKSISYQINDLSKMTITKQRGRNQPIILSFPYTLDVDLENQQISEMNQYKIGILISKGIWEQN